ncbi:sensor histidine kinase [Acinetobacter rongchengensis]|uniref:histidine kinase n=1 Tax=Acinetobacter rongchengensis TaxID=2419601 RepID=A0A3A8FAM7_9GAMM|nr:HAMP domain-containing sensor histidine kinase [Acinetobacter rongchengensis]RKG39484.1 sensor histidine kinase [Acinetobacter rongchengensis]
MGLEFLEAHQTDQLSACKLSLLLGVYTADNKIARFMRIARAILNVENAIFTFHNEPYKWIASEASDFQALLVQNKKNFAACFENDLVITPAHPHYETLSAHLFHLGIDHTRLLCYDLRFEMQESVAHVYFYDQQQSEFTPKQLDLLKDLTTALVATLQRNYESEDYYELYEQERALNFSKTKFFQVIAHDLRAPFHGLIGFSDVLANERDTLDDDNVQNIANYLYETLQSTYSLLENLLNWAMSEGGRFEYHPINFKLKQTSRIVYEVLNTLAVKKNIELIEDVPPDLTVYADMNMVTSIIQNLVSNALKFTHTDGTGKVSVTAKSLGQNIEITIKDSGLGMTQSQIDQVFEPKIKVSLKGTTGEKGTGLGLVLCKRFVDLNHGKISVSSNKGEGTTFKVLLPMAKEPHLTLSSSQVEQT